mmetsp:Transcript_13961/g.37470  ORF Transcript_13961/g.37470 Transcript_13961/m.37470 type:complete len:603 (+) Transcript_13961:349-2157(+)
MAKLKKGQRGNATNYITRRKALQKLQLGLADFRRLCILKGIFPRDPKKKAEGPLKTYYLAKDIQFLAHEPLVDKFREIRAHRRKLIRAKARNEVGVVKALTETRPTYQLDHIIRERYPRFSDALRDLDDALSTLHLFAALPAVGKISSKRVRNCARLCREFQHYVMRTHALRKVFASIKGIYYQVELQGELVTWLDPYKFAQKPPVDVDFRVMLTFLEFYESLIAFVNFRLYTLAGLVYPPMLMSYDASGSDLKLLKSSAPEKMPTASARKAPNITQGAIADAVREALSRVDDESGSGVDASNERSVEVEGSDGEEDEPAELEIDSGNEAENVQQVSLLFSGMVFFLCRETQVSALDFIIKSNGGETGWEGDRSPYNASNKRVTHVVMDRPKIVGLVRMDVDYVQPQWVFDCVNAETALPVALYRPGAVLPPHLSPFVDDEEEGYAPAYKQFMQRIKNKDPEVAQESALEYSKRASNTEHASSVPLQLRDKAAANVEEKPTNGESSDDGDSASNSEEDSASDSEGKLGEAAYPERKQAASRSSSGQRRAAEEKELRKMMMSRKHRKLYDTIQRGKQRRSQHIQKVIDKRHALDARNPKNSHS